MAIELISKIKPKNNGTFPLMDAADVEMPDGTRLSDFKGGVTSVNGQTGDVTITVTNGKDGKDGSNGEDGKDGQDGVSPSVSVSSITGGHRVTITDATGTKTFDVMDGESGSSASVIIDTTLSQAGQAADAAAVGAAILQATTEVNAAFEQVYAAIPGIVDEYIGDVLGGEY